MKMKSLVVFLIAVLSLSVAGWLVTNNDLQQQINELQEQNAELQGQNRDLQGKNDELQEQLNLLQKRLDFNPRVLITNFSSQYGWQNVVGMTIAMTFNVSVQNFGISDIEGLTVEIKRLNIDEDPHNITRKLDVLHAGETIEFREIFVIGWDLYFGGFHYRSLEASVKLGEVILDVRYFMPHQYL